MKTEIQIWNELINEKLNEMDMLKVRGGNAGSEEDPVGPIIK